jgi:hypothetical protein
MRKFLIPALIVASIAAPAAAQNRGGYDARRGGSGIERQIDQIEQQIDRLRDRRLISANESQRLSRQAEQIDRLHDRYRRDGLSRREHSDLEQRIQSLRQRVQSERREGRQEHRGRR